MKYKKRITLFLAALSLMICTGCAEQKQETEAILQRESVLYQKYSDTLQEMGKYHEKYAIFGENGWENAKDCYREVLSETIFGMCAHNNNDDKNPKNEMRGILAAQDLWYDGFGLRIAVSEADEVWEYGYYEDYDTDMKYITCRKTGAKEGDMPEYQLCEEVLNHGKVSGRDYITSAGDYHEAQWTEWLDKYGQMIDGEVTEYCVVDNHVYRIDREKEQFHDVTGQTESYMAQWLQSEKEKAYYGMKVTDEVMEKIKELIPDGYRLRMEPCIAVCDLNHDGEDDYVAVTMNMEHEKFWHTTEALWLFLSDGVSGYTKKLLLEGWLECYQLDFVGDGVLMCWNMYGMDFEKPMRRRENFLYDEAAQEFYLDKVCQCELGSGVLIEDRTTLERIGIGSYYRSKKSDNISSDWASDSYHVYHEERKVEFDRAVIYRNADKEMGKTVNDKIFEIEVAIAERLLFDKDIKINSSLNYLNPHIYGGCIAGSVWNNESSAYLDSLHFYLPVIIDLESGEFLDITDLLSKEEFIEICQKGMKDRYRIELSEEEMERGISLIQDRYEDAFRVTSSGELILTTEESWICLEITSWGVQVTGKDDAGGISFWLDKEYFIDTPLWHYMEPDFW
ncbi:MAG: hypothetical protein NC321_07500 [Clostridium sp.]|nr:hypothetical protein [Clostridium sp.]